MGKGLRVLLVVVIGGFARRAFGGWPAEVPGWVDITVLCGLAFLCTLDHGWLIALLVALVTGIGWRMGHGSYMDMGYGPPKDNERFAPVVQWLVPERLWFTETYDFIGMTVRYTLPAALIAAALLTWWFALVGLAVAVAYWAAWKTERWLPRARPALDGPTSYGEFIAGGVFYGLLLLA